jgi:hypothetical protein
VAHWTELRAEVAAILAATEPRLRERLFHVPGSVEGVEDRRSAWNGPRFRFRHLIGEAPTWSGPLSLGDRVKREGRIEWRCRFCHGRTLAWDTYCLACDRCGRELELPAVLADERSSAPQYVPEKLLGGLAGKR